MHTGGIENTRGVRPLRVHRDGGDGDVLIRLTALGFVVPVGTVGVTVAYQHVRHAQPGFALELFVQAGLKVCKTFYCRRDSPPGCRPAGSTTRKRRPSE